MTSSWYSARVDSSKEGARERDGKVSKSLFVFGWQVETDIQNIHTSSNCTFSNLEVQSTVSSETMTALIKKITTPNRTANIIKYYIERYPVCWWDGKQQNDRSQGYIAAAMPHTFPCPPWTTTINQICCDQLDLKKNKKIQKKECSICTIT